MLPWVCRALILGYLIACASGRSRFLLVSVDNRDLSTSLKDNHYPSMNAVLNHAYASLHGYDYFYLQNDLRDFVERTRQKYPHAQLDQFMTDKKAHVAKDVATGFHAGLQQFRAASWAKLPAIWYIADRFGAYYDYIFYIDSDAAVSAFQHNVSLEDALRRWQDPTQVAWGQRDVRHSRVIFFNNHPWRDDMPCAGTFMLNAKHAESLLSEWWDYDLRSKNFLHFHEQDALWHMIDHGRRQSPVSFQERWNQTYARRAPRNITSLSAHTPSPTFPVRTFRIHEESYSVLRWRQFPSLFVRYEESLFLIHIASYNYLLRTSLQLQALQRWGLAEPSRFRAAVDHILAEHVLYLSPLDLAEDMERAWKSPKAHSKNPPFRVNLWPPHDEKTQSAWYDAHVTSATEPRLPPAVLHEGRLLRQGRSLQFVHNHQRWTFQDFDAFLACASIFSAEMAIPVTPAEFSQVPMAEGLVRIAGQSLNPVITTDLCTSPQFDNVRAEVFKHYLPLVVTAAAAPSLPQGTSPIGTRPTCVLGGLLDMLVHSRSEDTEKADFASFLFQQRRKPTRGVARAHLFVLAHDAQSLKQANDALQLLCSRGQPATADRVEYALPSWITLMQLPSSVFFESLLYRDDQIPKLLRQLPAVEYVMTATYKTLSRALHYMDFTQTPDVLTQTLRTAMFHREAAHSPAFHLANASSTAPLPHLYDAVPVLRAASDLRTFVRHFHGEGFERAWNQLLRRLGYESHLLESFATRRGLVFYRNVFLMTKDTFLSTAKHMQDAMSAATTDSSVSALLSVDALYREAVPEVARSVFGTSYYQLHPFVFERLPSFFLHADRRRVCAAENGPCHYNT